MKEIDWAKWSAIAEILSAIAIVVTLVYLSVQTRYLATQTEQNTQALLSQSRQGLFESAQQEIPIWIEYPDLSAAIINSDIDLTLNEKIQLDSLMILALSRREFAWRQYQREILDEDSWNAERQIIGLLIGTERTRDWWDKVGRFSFSEDFGREVDMIIENQPFHPYWEGLANWQ